MELFKLERNQIRNIFSWRYFYQCKVFLFFIQVMIKNEEK